MRYFFFSYRCENDNKYVNGNVGFSSETFPSSEDIKHHIIKRNSPDMTVIISNWKEFNDKEDFDLFYGN